MKRIFLCSILCTAAVSVPAMATLSITPASVTLTNSQQVTLKTSGATAVRWSMTPSYGSLTASGTTAVFTVPAALNQSMSVTVQATNTSSPTQVAQAVLLLVPTVSITVAPASANTLPGGQVPLQATVAGSTDTAVIWSVNGIGAVDQTGLYTAPSGGLNTDTIATVTAAAHANPAKTVSVPVTVHANGIYFTTNNKGLQSLVYSGTDYNYLYGESLLTSVTMTTPTGANATYAPTCTGTNTATSVTATCHAGSDPLTLAISYGVPSLGTLQAKIVLTNGSATDTLSRAMISTLGVRMAQFDPTKSNATGLLGGDNNPVDYGSFVTGRFFVWTDTPGPNVSMNQACGWSYVCKNQPVLTNIGPGQSATALFSLRFTSDMTSGAGIIAPEAYTAYQAAYPSVIDWPDRRPIAAWFISDHLHQSATNPRGYLWNPALNVTDIAAFQTNVINQTNSLISSLKSRPVQPQGIIIWDLEGQEFIQPTTYVGDPRVFGQGYAPEMNAAADQMFAMFKAAGLKVGLTLRPQFLQWGPAAALPATCNFNSDNNYKDYYIAVDAPFQKDFYACYAPNVWSIIPSGNGGQTFYQPAMAQQVTNLLLAKVAYARARWGTTLYYVDTSVWVGGAPLPASVFRTLEQTYPDSLFIPEESYIATMGAALPYSAGNLASSALFAPVSWRYAYPNGAQVTNLSNCTGSCWTNNSPDFQIGQEIGDIALYNIPQQLSTVQLTSIEGMIQTARRNAGNITVTDTSSGSVFNYVGTPETIYKYPAKMRVYFADSVADIGASTTYCENGGLLGTDSCALNLAGLTVAQIRYYDFAGNLLLSDPAGPR